MKGNNVMIPVLLSGGVGSRLWPLSRDLFPKQFLALVGENTLLQDTILRIQSMTDCAKPIVVCNEEHRFMAAEQLRTAGIVPDKILLEPIGRNTAPAIALAALYSQREESDPLLLVLPSDHVILNVEKFQETIKSLADVVIKKRCLAAFGIVPSQPETGYGYIKVGEQVEGLVRKIERFEEKPNRKIAESYVKSGEYFWNSGMFLFYASDFLQELEFYSPEIVQYCRSVLSNSEEDRDFLRLDRDAFVQCPSISIDYAVMEKTQRAVMIPLDAEWNDIGSWSALWEIGDTDCNGNVIKGDVLCHDSHNCYVHSDGRLVSLVGVDGIVVVETPDVVMVAKRETAQDVKEIVSCLKASGRPEAHIHRKVYRPWGHYDSIDLEERFRVKRITVKPGAHLSLQLHHHRSEHWIVVRGTAQVTCGDNEFLLTENQSTHIPLGIKHKMANPGKIPLEMIEVQSGSYLDEDDIVRFEDRYGRV